MRQDPISINSLWEKYLYSIGEDPQTTAKTYTAWHFDNNPKDANQLAALVVQGEKRGTASLQILYDVEEEAYPQVGEISIITNWEGIAQCIIQTTNVELHPFSAVSADFAKIEGEGDKSLHYWQTTHRRFFRAEMAKIGRVFTEDQLVLCEEFDVIYPCENSF